MNGYVLRLLILFFTIASFTPVWSQISEGGSPPSFSFLGLRSSNFYLPYEAPIEFDVAQLKAEDKENKESGLPLRCAVIIPTELDFQNAGTKSVLPDGQHIWRLNIEAEGALAIMLYYDKFVIPEGGKLFIYSADHSKVLGAYTSKTNKKGGAFATEFVSGDHIVLEYVEPIIAEDEVKLPEILITGIAYGYNHLESEEPMSKARWNSASCEVNINCSEGDNWQDQKRGVARMLTPSGSSVYLCSGTLVNNTLGDFDPLFLTAHHCFSELTTNRLDQTVYYFNYEYPGCENLNTDPACPTLTGAQLLVDIEISGGSDGALLRLNDRVPESYNVYFNGWDRTNIAATSGVCIHHPNGDVKKISTYKSNLNSATWSGDGHRGATNAHWNAIFSQTENGHGVTEGGSSGSPLFNQDGRVIGTLSGGASACTIPSGTNLYGKLWYHWDQAAVKMATYLDPINSGVTYIDGAYVDNDVVIANFTVDMTEIVAAQEVTFTNKSRNATSWEWTFEGGEPSFSNDETPPAIIYNNPGEYEVKLLINKGTDKEKERILNITVGLKENYRPDTITIGNGTGQSAFPLGASQRQTLSSSIYTAEEMSLENGGYINRIAWNAGDASTCNRTLSIYLKETSDSELVTGTWSNEIKDATLVFASNNTWINGAGWEVVDLSSPFKYSGKENLKVMVIATTRTSSGYSSSQCYYSPAEKKHKTWIGTTSSIPSGNGTVNNNRPDIRFFADEARGVELPVAKFCIGSDTETNSVMIYEGEQVEFTDLSTGPVVRWKWSFPGGSPEESTSPNPVVTYSKNGTYDVGLLVVNNLGSDEFHGSVIVKKGMPMVYFTAQSEGFTMQSNQGRFLPPSGGKVTFENKTENGPVSLEWILEGANPEASTDEIAVVEYPEGEKTYDVVLYATNEKGTSFKTIPDYIKVGGTEKIWNIPDGDKGNTYYSKSTYSYVTGTNSYYTMIAERFQNNVSGSISKVDIMIKVAGGDVTSFNYPIYIYSDNSGLPGNLLATSGLPGANINPTGYTTVYFDRPVEVSGSFHVVIGGLSGSINRIAVASSKKSDNTVNIYTSLWRSLIGYFPEDSFSLSLNVVPEFTYKGGNSMNEILEDKPSLYPNPVYDQFIVSAPFIVQSIVIQDVQGRTIENIPDVKSQEKIVDTSGWSSGIYIVTVKSLNNTFICKIVKK